MAVDVLPEIVLNEVARLASTLHSTNLTDLEKTMVAELLLQYQQSAFSAKMTAIAIQQNMG